MMLRYIYQPKYLSLDGITIFLIDPLSEKYLSRFYKNSQAD